MMLKVGGLRYGQIVARRGEGLECDKKLSEKRKDYFNRRFRRRSGSCNNLSTIFSSRSSSDSEFSFSSMASLMRTDTFSYPFSRA